ARRQTSLEREAERKRSEVQKRLRGIRIPKTTVGDSLVEWLYEHGITLYGAERFAAFQSLRQFLANQVEQILPTLKPKAAEKLAAGLLKGKRPLFILDLIAAKIEGQQFNSLSDQESHVIVEMFNSSTISDEDLAIAIRYSLSDSSQLEAAEAA